MLLFTGSTGFLGRQILRQLKGCGMPIRLLVRDAGRVSAALSGVVETIETRDLFAEQTEVLRGWLDGVDTLVHAAWYAEPGRYLDSPHNLACLNGSLRLARAFIDAGGRRFVGIGTCFEYDLSAGLLSTQTPLRPQTLYGACKAATFQVLDRLLPAAGVELAWCRPFYLYGDGEAPQRLVAYLHRRLAAGEPAELSSGDQIRDYLDVEEAGAMIAAVALGGRRGGINICSGRPVTVRQLAERIADEYGRRDLLRFGARPDNPLDPLCVVGIRDGAN
ncbi:NAD-dependent epimerase/dehydratase family protein [Thiorhodococcus minor]|uniref:NAD(P)-dependent oxidoreductase n=1 Tax=Thiorhodococcus minor TaxID=57489 RepID=A0A6M0JVB8_9GAMM|nr:NAD(P)-dependent oxidoreductase [Thiorhodococcus minor]NEV60543.1 NAD(P)-dependent oxidoreductase [Thiorhodococcus minor]